MQNFRNDPGTGKKENEVGAGAQKMEVNLPLFEQYAAQSNKQCCSLAVSEPQTRQERSSIGTFCRTGLKLSVSK